MLLTSADMVGYIKARQAQQARAKRQRPQLGIAVVGQAAASASYIKAKQRYGEDIGVGVIVQAARVETELTKQIEGWNQDPAITGLIVQLPLPEGFNTDAIIGQINASKDVDGLRPDSPYEPATAKAITWLLSQAAVDLKSAKVCVVGQGQLVGRPVADMLEASGAAVDRCDISTADLASHTQAATVVITGTGQPDLLSVGMIAPGAVVIDAGTAQKDGRLVGDASPALYERSDITITPVPGGVGPMTVAALFDNLLVAAQR